MAHVSCQFPHPLAQRVSPIPPLHRCPLKTLQKCEIALEKLKNDMAVVSGVLWSGEVLKAAGNVRAHLKVTGNHRLRAASLSRVGRGGSLLGVFFQIGLLWVMGRWEKLPSAGACGCFLQPPSCRSFFKLPLHPASACQAIGQALVGGDAGRMCPGLAIFDCRGWRWWGASRSLAVSKDEGLGLRRAFPRGGC